MTRRKVKDEMKTTTKLRMILGLALCVLCAWAGKPKHVFLFIGDGMALPQRVLADEFSRALGNGPLAMNEFSHQSITRTGSANSPVTDSAAAATAIASGVKTKNARLGIDPTGERVESVAEFAKTCGMKVGIITTVPIVHATPAGFYAHRKSRNDSYGIAVNLLDSGFDFFAGSGVYDKHDDKKHAEYRGNVYELAEKSGYSIVRTAASLAALKPGAGKVWGVFSTHGMPLAINGYGELPNLAQMVGKAAELLEGAEGFFIMAEGGMIDYGAHVNDAATLAHEVIAMDDAVKVALAFQERHPDDTLVIVTGDHETGGLSLGAGGLPYDFRVKLLTRQRTTREAFSKKFGKALKNDAGLTFEAAMEMVESDFGLILDKSRADTDEKKKLLLTKSEVATLKDAFRNDKEFVGARGKETTRHDAPRHMRFATDCARILANHAGVSWSTNAHSMMPVTTTAKGCGAELFGGMIENTDIGLRIKDLLRR